ncbi:MAG: hypothetical protein KBA86_02365 [Bacteroidales bacterium]|nr:hypothetical protein [Bacteroidales bacterium]
MRILILIGVLFYSVFFSYSQMGKNVKFINSAQYIEKGIEKFSDKKWQEAEKLFMAVPFGDSLYYIAQYELAYAYEKQLRFNEAYQILYTLLEANDERLAISSVYTELANCYSENNQLDRAISVYDSALVLFPFNNQLHFNKGIVYQKKQAYDSAMHCFEKAIFCNPLHQTSHYQLGLSYIKQGYYIPGILALNYAAMMNPKKDVALTSLQVLLELYSVGLDYFNEDNPFKMSSEMEKRNEKYKKTETLLSSGFALNKQFKLKTKINHILTRQNQFVFENLAYDSTLYFIEDQLYIPFFMTVVKDKKIYDVFCHLLLMNTDVDEGKVSEKAIKMEKEIQSIWDNSLQMLNATIADGIGLENNENYSYEYNNKFNVSAYGPFSLDEERQRLEEGKWIILDNQGYILREGSYKKGKGHGQWKEFDMYGNVTQEFSMVNDTVQGEAYAYFERDRKENTKLLSMFVPLENGTITGIRRMYNRSGFLIENAHWANNLYNGEYISYYPQGMIKYNSIYKEGELLGISSEYYPNGELKSEIQFEEKDKIGKARYFFPGGKIASEGSVKNNFAVGEWKSYYYSGNVCYISNYNNEGKEAGLWVDYTRDGKIEAQTNYENGKKHGEEIFYYNGILMYKNIYKNGILTEINTFSPDGKIREKITAENKMFVAKIYSNELSNDYFYKQVSYKPNGDMHGKLITYAPNTKIISEVNYKDNLKEGPAIYYYPNGKIMSYIEYKDDNYHGLSLRYYENDSIAEEGSYINNEKTGTWYTYYMNGNVKSLEVYNNENILYKCEYFMDGKKSSEMFYKYGLLEKYVFYNENSEVIKTLFFENGNGIQNNYYLNGNIESSCNLLAGKLIDTCVWYSFDGKFLNKMVYYDGIYSGLFKKFHSINQNKVEFQLNYIMNEPVGHMLLYAENGDIKADYMYEYGTLQGPVKKYYNNGNLSMEGNYVTDVREGIFNFYAPDGKTITYKLMYNDDQIIAYAYMDKDNVLSDFKPMGKDKVVITSYYPTNKKSCEVTFVNGLRQEVEYTYYPNGKLFEESENLDNNVHGKYKSWNEEGQLKVDQTYYYGVLQGKSIIYLDNGNIYEEANYVYDELHGQLKRFDKNGKLILEQKWFYGNRLK